MLNRSLLLPAPEKKADRISKLFIRVFFILDAAAAFGFLFHSRLGFYLALLLVAWMALGIIALAVYLINRYRPARDELELRRMYSGAKRGERG
jgi:hypothetical protein